MGVFVIFEYDRYILKYDRYTLKYDRYKFKMFKVNNFVVNK